MSLYNLLFGMNEYKDLVLALIGLKDVDVERFRDCGFNAEGIHIYTRTGGGNREDYPNKLLTSNQWYISDEDDDFDSTYATYYFNIPDEIKDDINGLINPAEYGISAKLIKWVKKTTDRPETENDKYRKFYDSQHKLIKNLQQSMDISRAFNGHSILPLSDIGMELMLREIEKNDGEFIAYWNFLPYKFKVLQNKSKWGHLDDRYQVRIGIDIIWEIDMDAWNRYYELFNERYPLSIGKMKEKIDNR